MENLRSQLKRNYENRKIRGLHNLIKDSFESFFIEKNYSPHSSEPLISRADKSVIFTGSSLNAVKPIIISGNYSSSNGFVVSQECLRNHALKHAFDNKWLPFGQAYFNMSTILSRPGRFEEVVREAIDYTVDCLNVSPSQIILKSTKKLPRLRDVEKYTTIDVEFDSQEDNYYIWKLGIPRIHGEGITIGMKIFETESYLNVGNILRIIDNKNNERGIEFGYGHEFLLSTILGVKNPLELSQVFEVFPFNPDLSSKYYGYIEAVVRIKIAGVKTKNKGAGNIYRKYLKALRYMGKSLDKDASTVVSELGEYCDYLSHPTSFLFEKEFLNK